MQSATSRLEPRTSATTLARQRRIASIALAMVLSVVGLVAVTGGPTVLALNTNLLSLGQQTFENGISGWTASYGSTIVGVRGVSAEGDRSLRLRPNRLAGNDKGNVTAFAFTGAGKAGVPVTGGLTYLGAAQVRTGSQSRPTQCQINWYDTAGFPLAQTKGTLANATTAAWTRFECGGVAPQGAAYAALQITFPTLARGEVVYIDDAWLVLDDRQDASTDAGPVFAKRINAASTGNLAGPDGATFSGDQGYQGGSSWAGSRADIRNTNFDALYQKHRWGMRGYQIPVTAAGDYTVRLHFAETVFTRTGQRVFGVTAEGTQVVSDLDVYKEAGANAALVKEFTVKVTDGRLDLAFQTVVEDPMISGIEVVSVAEAPSSDGVANAPTTTVAPTTTTVAPTTTTVAPTTTTVAPTTTTTAAPAPTTTTTAAPAPTTTTTAAPRPAVPSAFPNASNTGPTGSLAPSGTVFTSANGQVIQNLDINGSIQVRHNNVTIRNVRVRNSGGEAIAINPANSGTVIEDCELDGTGDTGAAPAVVHARYTIRRCDIHHFGEGPRANGDVVIEDNYIHDFVDYEYLGAHQDGIQTTSGSNIVIRNNTIIIDVENANAAIMIGTAQGAVNNVVIDGNLLGGGGYTVYGGAAAGYPANATNVRITNNRFSTAIWPKSGWYGPLTNTYGLVVSGNIWDATGLPL
ncbi:MAG: malectin domain-containing carbohydrate-binding protein [Acidimicrobiia bacterium]